MFDMQQFVRRKSHAGLRVPEKEKNGISPYAAPEIASPVLRLIQAAAAYWAIVFLCGFALGAARVFLIVPRVGETAAVLLETPLMLSVSWIASTWCVKRFRINEAAGSRALLGIAAFTQMMVAELCLSLMVFRRTVSEHLSHYGTISGAVGLAAQLIFAAIPYLQARPLVGVRAVHTAIYLVMTVASGYVLYAGIAGLRDRLLWTALVLLGAEGGIFVGNGPKCPLTAVAVRYGAGKSTLFDTFLPKRITRHTFRIFAPLILLAVVLLGIRWAAFNACTRWIWLC